MKMSAAMSGSGKITFGALKELFQNQNIPDDAIVSFHSGDSQRDGPYWSFSATWGDEPPVLDFRERSNIGARIRQQQEDDAARLRQSQFGDH